MHYKKDLYMALDMGFVEAEKFIRCMSNNSLEKIENAGKLALRGYLYSLTNIDIRDINFDKKEYYCLGKYLTKVNIPRNKNIFKIAIDIYHEQNIATRKMVDTFAMCAKRLGVCKDIRIYIGKMIWEFRNE
jgi:hypothetical protein